MNIGLYDFFLIFVRFFSRFIFEGLRFFDRFLVFLYNFRPFYCGAARENRSCDNAGDAEYDCDFRACLFCLKCEVARDSCDAFR